MRKSSKKLLAEKISSTRLILFGSRARGDAGPLSDMDIMVIVDGDDAASARRLVSECAWEASFGSGIVLSPVVVSAREWDRGPGRASLLGLAVAREGVAI